MHPKLLKQYLKARDFVKGYGKLNPQSGPINFIDVGSVGSLPNPWHKQSAHIANLLKFEPRDNAANNNPNIVFYDKALWSTKEKRPFYVYKGFNASGSSLLRCNVEYVEQNFETLKKRGPEALANTWFDRAQLIKTIELECTTLDNVLAELNNTVAYNFLKIDAQGAEYYILKGAENFLKNNCAGLHLELFNVPLYKDMVLKPQVAEYLKGFGFSLLKEMPAQGTFHSQNDCVFIKNNHPNAEVVKAIKTVYGS